MIPSAEFLATRRRLKLLLRCSIESCLYEGHEVHECSVCGALWCATCGCQIHDHDESELFLI